MNPIADPPAEVEQTSLNWRSPLEYVRDILFNRGETGVEPFVSGSEAL